MHLSENVPNILLRKGFHPFALKYNVITNKPFLDLCVISSLIFNINYFNMDYFTRKLHMKRKLSVIGTQYVQSTDKSNKSPFVLIIFVSRKNSNLG